MLNRNYVNLLSLNVDFCYLVELDECLSKPCEHNGKCENLVNEFLCHCESGYTGTTCQIGEHKIKLVNVCVVEYRKMHVFHKS